MSSSHEAGVQHMEAGRWNEAATAFVDALHHAKGKAVPREAQYLAAVRLCKVREYCYAHIMCERRDDKQH